MITDQPREGIFPVLADMVEIISLEVAVVLLVESNQDGHHFTQAQGTFALPSLDPLPQQRLSPLGFKLLADIVDFAEQLF